MKLPALLPISLFITILIPLCIFSIVTESSVHTLEILINGPLQVTITQGNNFTVISKTTSLRLQGNITIQASTLQPGYQIFINGIKANTLTLNSSLYDLINVTAVPTYVDLKVIVNNGSNVQIRFDNGSYISIKSSSQFLVRNDSYVYITTPIGSNSIINNVSTNFYILFVTNDSVVNVTFVKSHELNSSSSPSVDLLGVGLGVMALAIYLIIKRRQ
ncbi:hypothetical protein [Sulfolobus acidocaldarius]|uniref:Uncharacterized protein n=3 Tax=Sulfolobus acidocaldarius TaxID=2285 RepID=A0A0U2W518_9CREN|nr:hypothetical protein [Sulfolobus acidocaldarius]AGE70170.1 hypothetical protein SacN8_00945 [Sulfolobus acidocaldarius N8]AGE72445.1 hypothetical protein SacRon12I_00945 [Sulfolobus acidocaldarius Ron12/I]ALU29420.1 hypothetical protein ATY89_05300 [Sulfolobus acidocaldarius]ALU32148.1 hypothetical protein ATZ20_08320 [Sulfolobus acidocaldarius]WCM34190.1 hypothetical protein GO597_01975 [Sulfolobus acidocaldarius DSM 639]